MPVLIDIVYNKWPHLRHFEKKPNKIIKTFYGEFEWSAQGKYLIECKNAESMEWVEEKMREREKNSLIDNECGQEICLLTYLLKSLHKISIELTQ